MDQTRSVVMILSLHLITAKVAKNESPSTKMCTQLCDLQKAGKGHIYPPSIMSRGPLERTSYLNSIILKMRTMRQDCEKRSARGPRQMSIPVTMPREQTSTYKIPETPFTEMIVYTLQHPDRGCYTTKVNIRLYNGTRNVSRSGLPCKRWEQALQKDFKHFRTGETVLEAENYCRGSVYKEGSGYTQLTLPWCYINKTKRWEYCDVEACEPFMGSDCFTVIERGGQDVLFYNGTTSTTESGHTCRRWDSTGNIIRFTSGESVRQAANYCRVVVNDRDNMYLPWCYVNSRARTWEVCKVRLCSKH